MKPICCNLIRSTAAVCVLMVSGFVSAEDGVVRLSDQASAGPNSAGVVRMSDRLPAGVRPASYLPGITPIAECGAPQAVGCQPGCCAPDACSDSCGVCGVLTCDPCCNYTHGRQAVGTDCCDGNGCYGQSCSGCCSNGSNCGCNGYGCNQCCCNGQACCYGNGYNQRMNTLFAGPVCSGTGSRSRDHWRGQALSFRAKNARLADKLFGWMVPSGCCGQGCPPVGKYHMTYADQPDYADPRDAQMYAAQGYGMPMTVPLAPNVHQQYNYSWGVPASRITQISNYNPQSSPQPLYHQSWHSGGQGPAAGHVHSLGETVSRTKSFFHPGGF